VSGTNTGGATLAFALASNSTPGTGYYSFTNPSLNSSLHDADQRQHAELPPQQHGHGGADDLTSSATLQLRSPTFVRTSGLGQPTAFNGATYSRSAAAGRLPSTASMGRAMWWVCSRPPL